jgi:hypothetical protein
VNSRLCGSDRVEASARPEVAPTSAAARSLGGEAGCQPLKIARETEADESEKGADRAFKGVVSQKRKPAQKGAHEALSLASLFR